MSERVEAYRLNADKCLELAETFKDPDAKRTMFAMADAWLTLAAQRVKNIETVVPPLAPRPNPALPDDPSQASPVIGLVAASLPGSSSK
jgi:hypothetical protein